MTQLFGLQHRGDGVFDLLSNEKKVLDFVTFWWFCVSIIM